MLTFWYLSTLNNDVTTVYDCLLDDNIFDVTYNKRCAIFSHPSNNLEDIFTRLTSRKEMDSIYHSNIKLVLKNNTWVPKKTQNSSALDQHGLDIKKVLGEGAFAKVKLAYSKKDKKDVAVKIFEKRRLPMDYLKKFLPREIRILNSLNHPHLVSRKFLFVFKIIWLCCVAFKK